MPILKSYHVVNKKQNSIKCLDIIHVEKTEDSENVNDLITKLVYGDEYINWKYAIGIRKGNRNMNKVDFNKF